MAARKRRGSAAARLLRLWVRISPTAWMPVCCECYVLSGRGRCDKPISWPEESYRVWCVVVCDLETSWMRRPWPTGGCCAKIRRKNYNDYSTKLNSSSRLRAVQKSSRHAYDNFMVTVPAYRVFRIGCVKIQDAILWVTLSKNNAIKTYVQFK